MSTRRGDRAAIHAAMVRLADGDRSAAAQLVAELWPVLYAFARRAVLNADDAQDIAQESLIKLSSRIADFDRTRDGLSWAFAIASYEVKSYLKRIQRRREVIDDSALEQLGDAARSPELTLVDDDLERALQHVLEGLAGSDIEALGLVTAASACTAASPTMRKRRQRALERLKSAWRELYD